MPNIVLIGATGALGRVLVRRLAPDHELLVLSRRPGRADLGLDVPTAPLDDLEAHVAAAPVVINLAGEPILGRWTDQKWARVVSSRVDLTRRIAAAMQGGFLLNGSAVGVYGDRGDDVLDEGARPGEGRLARLCVDWEAAARPGPGRVALLRTGVVLDPASGALSSMLPAFRLGLGGPVAGGRAWQPWVHVDDWVRGVVHVLEQGLEGPVNLVAPGGVRQRELARTLGATLGRPAVLPVPELALRLVLGDAAQLLTDSQRVQPRALTQSGFVFRFPELGDALRDLLSSPEPAADAALES